jgi:tRNA (guanine-N7-)-methyltransferase
MKKIKSFSRRVSKNLSKLSRQILTDNLPLYSYNEECFNHCNNLYIEIGCGTGEHLINQAILNPQNQYLGVEPYLNGIVRVLKDIEINKINNIHLFADDIDLILDKIPMSKGFYILFPDPWPKSKHIKRRLVNQDRLNLLIDKLNIGGIIYFVSDIQDYFDSVKELFEKSRSLKIESQLHHQPYPDYVQTKYHRKAIEEKRIVQFLLASKIN